MTTESSWVSHTHTKSIVALKEGITVRTQCIMNYVNKG